MGENQVKLSPELEFQFVQFCREIDRADLSDVRAMATKLCLLYLGTLQTMRNTGIQPMNGLTAQQINQVAEVSKTVSQNYCDEKLIAFNQAQIGAYCNLQSQIDELKAELGKLQASAEGDLKEHERKGYAVSTLAALVLMVLFAATMRIMGA